MEYVVVVAEELTYIKGHARIKLNAVPQSCLHSRLDEIVRHPCLLPRLVDRARHCSEANHLENVGIVRLDGPRFPSHSFCIALGDDGQHVLVLGAPLMPIVALMHYESRTPIDQQRQDNTSLFRVQPEYLA